MESIYDRVVSLIYQAAAGTVPWKIPFDELAKFLDAWNVHLMGIDHGTGIMQFSHEGGDPPAEGTLDYIQTWHRVDPRAELVMQGPENRWTHCHEHHDEDFVRNNSFYRDFIIPYGMRYISGVRFPPIGPISCIFSASRAIGKQPFDDSERALLARVGEHLYSALQMRAIATTATRHAMAGIAVLERINYPILLVDAQRAVLFKNRAARTLLSSGAPISDATGILRITQGALDAKLTHLLKSLELTATARLTQPGGTHQPERPILILNDASGHNLVLHLARMMPEEVMGAFGTQSLTLVTAFSIKSNLRIDPYVVQMVFGMTPAEARVAAAIANGQSPEQVADSVGVSMSTVRTQLSQSFAKTGVRGQSELASLLAGNPLYWGGIAA